MRIINQLSGSGAIYQTVQQMKQMINEGSIDPIIRKQAFLATRHCDRNDKPCKIHSILSFIKNNMEYVFDPTTFELLQHPKLLARAVDKRLIPYGDCDDFSMYLASLLKSIGLFPKLKIIGTDMSYHHVYVICDGYVLDGTSDEIEERPYTKSFVVNL